MKKSCIFFVSVVMFLVVAVGTALAQEVPEGFTIHKIEKGDTLEKIAPEEHHNLIMKVNRFDKKHLPIGKKILIPVDFIKASEYTPVPEYIEEAKEEERSIYVFLDKQYFGAYENGELVFWGPISSGRGKRMTKKGTYKANKKELMHRSRLYGGAPMPFSVNLSKNMSETNYFLHEQDMPGYPASHGCVRLLRDDAKKIYNWIKINDPVEISS
ncbi:MAG TPA: L,D-transpeptidase family protein [Candidatus Moranbacteria bacterium]|nr:L,D-transpeptidase family protein [Candidatus Moranbacteria bacterium]